MKAADSLGAQGRFQRLAPDIDDCFDLELMIQVAAGGYWYKAEESEHRALLAVFRRMSIGTYASQFSGHSGETFETLGERPGPQSTLLVKTRINHPAEDAVRLTYVLSEAPDGWRIADILLDDDVSQLATRRSEYRRILKTKGISGLIAVLDAKTDSLLKE